jgi:hypothetical protein
MQPDPTRLLKHANITLPLIGVYDAPDTGPFEPIVTPEPGRRVCIFSFFQEWLRGETLQITRDNYGCAGAGRHFCDVNARSREDLVKFLVDGEGLKASHELMNQWVDRQKPYCLQHGNIFIGPLKPDQYEYLKTVTFCVNPDQLGLLSTCAQYWSSPDDPTPVIAPFGAGCMHILTAFDDLDVPQALIGGSDIAMRQHLPPDILCFTVTRPMFERLCRLDEKSLLYKPFWSNLQKARGAKPGA